MSSARGGRAGARGRGTFTLGQSSGGRVPRPGTQSRDRAANNSVRFNGAPTRAGATTASAASRRGQPARAMTRADVAVAQPVRTHSSSGQSTDGDSYQQRFLALKKRREQDRADAIKQGFLADPDRPRTLAEAITPVGTCPDMCAEFERVERVVQKDVWGPETAPDGADGVPAEARMVKKFRRAAAGIDEQLPSDLRPPAVLKKTVEYLFDDVVGNADSLGSVHHFVWDRTRAIRNDFSIQQITKPSDVEIAIECYERIARFHILSLHQLALPEKPYDKYDWYQEREQLDRTLLSLIQYYDDNNGRVQCKNEAEFRAYCVIMQVQDPTPDLEERVNSWDALVKTHPRVRLALDLYAAASNTMDVQGPLKPRTTQSVARQDWHGFFTKVDSNQISYLMACTAEIYFNLVRKQTLNAIWRAFKRQGTSLDVMDFTLDVVTDWLAFDDVEQTENFCQHYGFVFKASANSSTPFLDLNSVQGKTFPEATQGLSQQTFSDSIVESKRAGRTLSAIIRGMSVVQAQHAGMVEESNEGEDEEMDEEDSLFVPNGPAGAIQQGPSAFAVPGQTPSPFTPSPTAPSNNGIGNSVFGKLSTAPTTTTDMTPPKSSPFNFTPSTTTAPKTDQPKPFQSPFATSLGDSRWAQSPPTQSNFGQVSKDSSAAHVASPFAPKAHSSETPGAPVGFGGSSFGKPSSTSPFSSFTPTSPEHKFVQKEQVPSFGAKQEQPATSIFAQAPSQPSPSPSSFSFGTGKAQSADNGATPTSHMDQTTKVSSITAQSRNDTQTSNKSIFTASSQSTPSTFGNRSEQQQSKAQAPLFSFTAPPSVTPQQNPPASVSEPQSASASPPGKQATPNLPTFAFPQPNQPKKPSPLFQSFSAPEKAAIEKPSVSNALQTLAEPAPRPAQGREAQAENSAVASPKPLPKQMIPAPRQAPKIQPDEILQRLAREVMLDLDKGLLKQFVEYHARTAIMDVYEELNAESNRKLADTFRMETLAHRYGKRWRETCWRLRLARIGREKRRRTRKNQESREVKKKRMEEVNAVDDFLSRSQTGLNGSLQGREEENGHATPLTSSRRETRDRSSNVEHSSRHEKSRLDRANHVPDRDEAETSPPSTIVTSSIHSRSHFLGFSLPGSQPGERASMPISRSNYFRMKAMGIDPNGGTSVSSNTLAGIKKRPREDSETESAVSTPAAKRSRSPPRAVAAVSTGRLRSESIQSRSSRIAFSPAPSSVTSSKPMSRAQQDDEILFARARAAREGLSSSAAWYRSEVQGTGTARSPDPVASPASASMQRARMEARLRASQRAEAQLPGQDVPAYRLRESRFVPRDHYAKAIERAKGAIEARYNPASQLDMQSPAGSRSILPSAPPTKQHSSFSGRPQAEDVAAVANAVPVLSGLTQKPPSLPPPAKAAPFDGNSPLQESYRSGFAVPVNAYSAFGRPTRVVERSGAHESAQPDPAAHHLSNVVQPLSQAASAAVTLLSDSGVTDDNDKEAYSTAQQGVQYPSLDENQHEELALDDALVDNANPFGPLYGYGQDDQDSSWALNAPNHDFNSVDPSGTANVDHTQYDPPMVESVDTMPPIDPQLLGNSFGVLADMEVLRGGEQANADQEVYSDDDSAAAVPVAYEENGVSGDEFEGFSDERPPNGPRPSNNADGAEDGEQQFADEEEDYDEEDDMDDGEEGVEDYSDEEDQEEDEFSDDESGDEPPGHVSGTPDAAGLIKAGTGVSAEDAFELSD